MGWFLYDRNLRHERVKYRIFRPFHVNGLFCCANQMTSFYIMGRTLCGTKKAKRTDGNEFNGTRNFNMHNF